MEDRKIWLMRLFGAANIAVSAVSLQYAVSLWSWNWHRWPDLRTGWPLFLTFSLLSLSMLVTLVYAGIQLLRGRKSGIYLTGIVCSLELLLFLIMAIADVDPRTHTLIFLALGATHVHIVTGYAPVAALVMLIIRNRGLTTTAAEKRGVG